MKRLIHYRVRMFEFKALTAQEENRFSSHMSAANITEKSRE